MPNWTYNRLCVVGRGEALEDFRNRMGSSWANNDSAEKFSMADFVPCNGYWDTVPEGEEEQDPYEVWGVKWDASEVEIWEDELDQGKEEINITFATPWSHPEPFYEALVKMYPELIITFTFQEESNAFYGYFSSYLGHIESEIFNGTSCNKETNDFKLHVREIKGVDYTAGWWISDPDDYCECCCEKCENEEGGLEDVAHPPIIQNEPQMIVPQTV